MARAELTWAEGLAKECRKRAVKRWGGGWQLLSEEQRDAFLAREVVSILLAQAEEHASEPVKELQALARLTMFGGC